MPKRNFILLIIILAIAVIAVFGFLYFRGKGNTTGDSAIPGINFLSQFNPFRSNPATTPGNGTTATDTDGNGIITPEEMQVAKLKKISSMAIAGFTVFMKERLKDVSIITAIPPVDSGTSGELTTPPKTAVKKPTTKPTPPATEFMPALRYVERATGNIFQTFADKIEEKRFSTTVIPKIYEAYFGNSGQSVIIRRLKTNERTIETFVGRLPKEKIGEDTTSSEITGSFLADDIKDISISSDTLKTFYLLNPGNSIIGTIFNILDGKKTQIFDSAFTEWLSFWPSNNIITLTTKPSGAVPGYMYMLDVSKKSLTKVLGEVNGLTTVMSPNGKLILYGNNNLTLSIYHTDTKVSESLGVRTLPEKCVWNKTNEFIYCAVPTSIDTALYPDDWYRGEISFSDQIWKINLINGSTTMVVDPVITTGEDVDGIKLALDRDENYLFFVNKKDSFLWELSLK